MIFLILIKNDVRCVRCATVTALSASVVAVRMCVRAPHSGAVRGDGCCFGFEFSVRTEYTLLLVTQQMYDVAGRECRVCVCIPHTAELGGGTDVILAS